MKLKNPKPTFRDYYPKLYNSYPKHYEETSKQIAIDIDKDILERIMKMTPITFKHGNTIILRKRNYVPNNKLIILL